MAFAEERPVPLVDLLRQEWPLDGADGEADVEADVRAWREGAELYEDGDDDELLHAGELMAMAVRHHLHGGRALREDDLAVTVHSLLFAAGTPVAGGPAVSPEASPPVAAQACRLARLALAVIAQQGWQPPHLGGNGHITAEIFEDVDIQRLLAAALAPDADLAAFFLANKAL